MFHKVSWQKMQAMGKAKFIMRYGVYGWGLLTAIFFLVLEIVTEKRFNLAALLSLDFLKQCLLAICFFSLGGYLWGLLMWINLRKKMQKKK